MAMSIGKIEPFDDSCENWVTYVERVEQYFITNDVDTDKRVPALLSLIGSKTYGLLRSLTAPEKPSTKTFDDIVEILKRHLSPKPLVIAERFRFHKRDQRDGESISAFIAEIRKLSEHCEFGSSLDATLRDRLVCGLRNEAIQKRLLTEEDLTFKRAIDLAVAMETAAKDATELQSLRQSTDQEVHKMSAAGKPTYRFQKQSVPCYRCSGTNHDQSFCRFKNAICHGCSKRGHILIACKSTSGRRSNDHRVRPNPAAAGRDRDVHAISDDESPSVGVGSIEIVDNYHLESKARDKIWLTVKVNGRLLKMELDTGSGVSIINKSDYLENFSSIPLQETSVLFRTYTGEKLKPEGVIYVRVEYNGKQQEQELKLYVVSRGGPPLFGREWLKHIQLDWQSIKYVETTQTDTKTKLNQLLKKYKDVFAAGLGKLENIRARLTVVDNAEPKFAKARQLPYALKPKVEAELDNLEQEGVLSKVDYSDWATPIVPVVKRNNTVRICGDFKTTLNPVLQVDKYPLPRIEDIFASLAGGQKFTKIDL